MWRKPSVARLIYLGDSRTTTDDVADGWQYARGWRGRTAVSPDYETAALYCCNRICWRISTQTRKFTEVVIGAGIPPNWISQSFSVSTLLLPGGSIAWKWDDHRPHVTLKGPNRR